MSADLYSLVKNRDNLLLAEIGAWLHDMGKCHNNMIIQQARKKTSGFKFDYKGVFAELVRDGTIKNTYNVRFLGQDVPLGELVEKGMPRIIKEKNKPWIVRVLGRCHATAHIEKEEPKGKGLDANITKQLKDSTRPSNPFGFEGNIILDLTSGLKSLPYHEMTNRSAFVDAVRAQFKKALGDTRRPINEVTLEDWSSIIAATYKASLAGALLGQKPEPNDLKWRLLAIRFDSASVLGKAMSIPVLLSQRDWLNEGLNDVKKLLEETYPIGNEVYRDENGSIYVVPDITDLLSVQDSSNGKSLTELIKDALNFDGEIVVAPRLSSRSWLGQHPSRDPKKVELPDIGEIIKQEPYSPPDLEKIREWWINIPDNTEPCSISRVRPSRAGKTGLLRNISDYWAYKIQGRVHEWLKDRDSTIWFDEVADSNGRICLLTGKINVSEWFTSDGHIQSLLTQPPDGNPDQATTKNPSFVRMHRIWTATKNFWEEVVKDIHLLFDHPRKRLAISGTYSPSGDEKPMRKDIACEVEARGVKFSAFYAGNGRFLIIENLEWLVKKFNGNSKSTGDYSDAMLTVQEQLNGLIVRIHSTEEEKVKEPLGTLVIETVTMEPSASYRPVIPVMTEPSTFMVIIPATCALQVMRRIKEKYEQETGKVRDRLPLLLGAVFA
ncbi:MAG: CRISPR-associated protein Csx11, partial [Candidatus Odinarchaeota archaeon]